MLVVPSYFCSSSRSCTWYANALCDLRCATAGVHAGASGVGHARRPVQGLGPVPGFANPGNCTIATIAVAVAVAVGGGVGVVVDDGGGAGAGAGAGFVVVVVGGGFGAAVAVVVS